MKTLISALALVSVAAYAQVPSFSMPDQDLSSSEFVTMGDGWSSLQPHVVDFMITVPPDQPRVTVEVFNGDMRGAIYKRPRVTANWAFVAGVKGKALDIQATGQGEIPEVQNQMMYSLFAESSTPISIKSGDSLTDLSFATVFNVVNEARLFPSQFAHEPRVYRLRMEIAVRNSNIEHIYHLFKIRANAPFETKDKIGFANKNWRLRPYIGLPGNMESDNRHEVNFTPSIQTNGETCILRAFNGDVDKATDSADKNPVLLARLPFTASPDAVEEGINPGNPQDFNVKIDYLDPDGDKIDTDYDASGDREWEKHEIVSVAPGCNEDVMAADRRVSHLQSGTHTLVVRRLQQDNVIFLHIPEGIDSRCNETCD